MQLRKPKKDINKNYQIKDKVMNRIIKILVIVFPFLFGGCEFIGDVFKAGIWVGVVIVIAILAVTAFIVKSFKN